MLKNRYSEKAAEEAMLKAFLMKQNYGTTLFEIQIR